jgi:hypothetical protein
MRHTAMSCLPSNEYIGTNSGARRACRGRQKFAPLRTSEPRAIFKFGMRNLLCSDVVQWASADDALIRFPKPNGPDGILIILLRIITARDPSAIRLIAPRNPARAHPRCSTSRRQGHLAEGSALFGNGRIAARVF